MSYNKVKEMQGLTTLRSLRLFYLASNRLRAIGGLEAQAASLKMLDLGMNKIRELRGVGHLENLEELWLGKNKIAKIEGIASLTRLRKLDLQVRQN